MLLECCEANRSAEDMDRMKDGREEEQEEEKSSLIQGDDAHLADVLLRFLSGIQKK